MKPKAIFFDLFNTLLHFDFSRLPEVSYRGEGLRTTLMPVYEELRADFGLQASLEEFLDAFFAASRQVEALKNREGREYPSHKRFELMRRELGLQRPDSVERMVQLHMGEMFRAMYLPEANLRVVERLEGYPKVLASNFDHAPTARKALRTHGIEPHLESIFISEEVGWRKPFPRFFEIVSRKAGYRPEECLFVGDDAQADCAGAGRAGFQVAWLNDKGQPPPDPAPRWQVRKLEELPSAAGL